MNRTLLWSFLTVLGIVLAVPLVRAQPREFPVTQAPDSATNDGVSRPRDEQPHIVVTLPAPAPVKWPMHDRILWAALLVLVILGYASLYYASEFLKRFERQTVATEAAALAASEAAKAALIHTRSLIDAERPWIMVSVEPTLGVENSFNVTATNRGRSPARITSTLSDNIFAVDEAHLPMAPAFKPSETNAPAMPIILLPGEYAAIKTIKREDARELSGTEDRFKKIESWDERLFLCGKVLYDDLIMPSGEQTHETTWCCWYIHGRQKSGLVIAGPPSYHLHT